MPLIGGRIVALALEDVTQMAAAVGADDLGARHAERAIFVADDGAGDAVKVGRPAAAGAELVSCLVERRVASGARVHARVRAVLVVLSGAGPFGSLFAEDAELLYLDRGEQNEVADG